jgi:hypothetical protein
MPKRKRINEIDRKVYSVADIRRWILDNFGVNFSKQACHLLMKREKIGFKVGSMYYVKKEHLRYFAHEIGDEEDET